MKYPISLLVVFAFASCSKNQYDHPTGNYIDYKVNGRIVISGTVDYLKMSKDVTYDKHHFFLYGYSEERDAVTITFSDTSGNILSGTYPIYTLLDSGVSMNQQASYNDDFYAHQSSPGTLTIVVDTAKKRISGTFSFHGINSSGSSADITGGKFSMPYP